MIVTLEEAKQHLRVDFDDDDDLITAKIEAAGNQLERMLGYAVADTFGGVDQDPVPPALKEAVLQLVTTWFENRATVAMDVSLAEMPISFQAIVCEYREWSF
ncbi:DNA-packaging protein [Kaistia algarum]|uniref:head-tail connector protein n=1 Tax=Kaistia algarum TaxID=2083279 RepID=UPI000CE7E524|nr:head-tail connector protein [Kaistia algarum]MCX5513730.1 head-tail connector protein [Kaistia algarum]PPE79398.1 DNA-packaging protein [Kaistia algarum]